MKIRKKCIILSVLLLLLVGITVIFVNRYYSIDDKPVIEGRIEATSYYASSKVAGRIEELYVSEGDWVNEGELLYIISTPELDAKLLQVDALRTQAQAINREVDMGARIEQLEALRGLVQRAEAGESLARKNFNRVEELYSKGVVARQLYDEAKANLDAMSASVSSARAEYNLALAGATQEQREAVAAKVVQAQGAVDELISYIDDRYVYAPTTGRVTSVVAHKGELVGVGYPVVTILNVDECWATFNIREDHIHGVNVGDTFVGHLPALDADVEFEVYYIASQADFATWNSTRAQGGVDLRSFEVRARPVSSSLSPLPGMSVVVRGDRL